MAKPTATFIKERLGGATAVAEKTGRKPAAIRMWAHRRAIPRSVWPELLDAYDHLTIEDLRAVETEARAAP